MRKASAPKIFRPRLEKKSCWHLQTKWIPRRPRRPRRVERPKSREDRNGRSAAHAVAVEKVVLVPAKVEVAVKRARGPAEGFQKTSASQVAMVCEALHAIVVVIEMLMISALPRAVVTVIGIANELETVKEIAAEEEMSRGVLRTVVGDAVAAVVERLRMAGAGVILVNHLCASRT